MRSAVDLVLVGPCPPPHGGISVHVAEARRQLEERGARCGVVDSGHARPGTLASVRRQTAHGATMHLHTNGHNVKSWLVALGCGRAAGRARGRVLTLHSGMVPQFLDARAHHRLLARLVMREYERVLCVNDSVRDAVDGLGVDAAKLQVVPAFLPVRAADGELPSDVAAWMARHQPVLTTALCLRPEYGFDVLLEGLVVLARRHPRIGCVVLGVGPAGAAQVRAHGLDDSVLLAGDVAHGASLGAMAGADVFVRPTLEDGDAVSVREALQLGRPVVASDAGHRPAGVVLFPKGDGARMAQAVLRVLSCETQAPPPQDGAGAGVDALLQAYREAARGRGAVA